jgi:prophage regulatory protein
MAGETGTADVPVRILRLPEVCQRTGLSRAMIYRLQAARRFPQSVRITAYAVGWIEGEVQAWLLQRIARSRVDPKGIARAEA